MRRAIVSAIVPTILIAVAAPAGSAVAPSCVVPGFDDRCEAWSAALDSPWDGTFGWDAATDLAVAPAGDGVFVTGRTAAADGITSARDVLTAAYEPDGTLRWQDRYDGIANARDYAYAVGVSPDGSRVYVAGAGEDRSGSRGESLSSFLSIAYDSRTGARLWTATYDGSDVNGPYGYNVVADLAVAPDGVHVFVTGQSLSGTGRMDALTIAYEAATGHEVWRARYDDAAGGEFPTMIDATEDGRVYVTGYRERATGGFDTFTLAYDSLTAGPVRSELWSRRDGPVLPPSPALGVRRMDMDASPSGDRIFVTLSEPAVSRRAGVRTVAYGRDGERLWEARWAGGPRQNEISDLTVSPDGATVYAIGTSTEWTEPHPSIANGEPDATTLAYDAATGAERWKVMQELPGVSWDWGRSVSVSPNGAHVYSIQQSSDVPLMTLESISTVSYASDTGALEWAARVRPAAAGRADAVDGEVDPQGKRLYVAGMVVQRPDVANGKLLTTDLATVAYDL